MSGKYTDVTLEIQPHQSLAGLNTLGLDVTAEHLVVVRSEAEIREALTFARDRSMAVTVLGGGSNVVLAGNIAGLVIVVGIPGILFDGDVVEAGAGEAWHQLVLSSLEQGLCGVENLSLIPGSVGAAPIQNIGAYGAELDAVFDSLTAVDRATLDVVTFDRAQCEFGYRDSIFKRSAIDQFIITSVRLTLSHQFTANLAYDELKRELDEQGVAPTARLVSETVCRIRARKLPDPRHIGNVGSFFKNPVVTNEMLGNIRRSHPGVRAWPQGESHSKVAAGWLIEASGLKGHHVGGAAMSSQHALVMINAEGKATPGHVMSLASEVKKAVADRFDVELEIEPVVYNRK